MTTADLNGDGFLDLAAVEPFGATRVLIFAGTGDGSFEEPKQISSEGGAAISTFDVDLDGLLDIVYLSSGLCVQRNKGDLSFTSPQCDVGSAVGLTIGDWNEDGFPDIATASNNGAAVRLGLGGGNFTHPVVYQTLTTPQSIDQLDADHDGHRDLIVGGSGLSLFRGNGLGVFLLSLAAPNERIDNVHVADLNHDGRDDAVLAHGSFSAVGELRVFLSVGDGRLPEGPTHPVGTGEVEVALADFTQDGDLDVVATALNRGELNLYSGDGHGGLELAGQHICASEVESITTGDYDEDGFRDLVVAGRGIYLLGGAGADGIHAPRRFSLGSPAPIRELKLAHLNADEFVDVAAFNSSKLFLFLGDGTGTVYQSFATDVFDFGPPFTLADFNEDGLVDAAASASNSQVAILLGDGRGGLTTGKTLSSEGILSDIDTADFNADGHLDLCLTPRFDEVLRFHGGDGQGGFFPVGELDVGRFHREVTVCQWDDEDHLDLVITGMEPNSTYGRDLLLLKGDGDFGFTPLTMIELDTVIRVAAEDLDANGTVDMAVTGFASADIFWGLGNGDFVQETVVRSVPGSSTRFRGLSVGDWNGDRLLDLVVGLGSPQGFQFLLGDGAGNFTPTPIQSVVCAEPGDPIEVSGADFDQNGIDDLALWGFDSGLFALTLNRLPDCNASGLADACDIAQGLSRDQDRDGIPDECFIFRRGDVIPDGSITISDAVEILDFLMATGELVCLVAADINDDNSLTLEDSLLLLDYLFLLGPPPMPPFVGCGFDPSPDATLDCQTSVRCL